MIDFQDARKKILNAASSEKYFSIERVSLAKAAGRVLAEEVVSPIQVPTHDYSAMDGYAVCAGDFAGDQPISLPVVGQCQTGHPGVPIEPGQCVRIFTGAHIPPGADAVVMQENTTREGDRVTVHQAPRAGENIRRAGEDLSEGATVLTRGHRLTGFHLGLLASVERTEVLVASRPRVMILCTGDELRPPGSAWSTGNLAESNSIAVASLVEAAGAVATVGPLVVDDREAMKRALRAARRSADVIVTVGGVSVGDHDVVAPALAEVGAEVAFHKVKIKPGKPVLFAEWDGTLILGLPGNPSSAQVTFALFGIPLIRALQGDARSVPAERRARLKGSFKQKPGRRGFYRAQLEGDEVELLSNQASGASTAIAWANAFAVIGEDETFVAEGAEVSVISFNDL